MGSFANAPSWCGRKAPRDGCEATAVDNLHASRVCGSLGRRVTSKSQQSRPRYSPASYRITRVARPRFHRALPTPLLLSRSLSLSTDNKLRKYARLADSVEFLPCFIESLSLLRPCVCLASQPALCAGHISSRQIFAEGGRVEEKFFQAAPSSATRSRPVLLLILRLASPT